MRRVFIVYQHFEKPVSSKKIMNVNSAQSMQCKKNIHVQEVVRRLLNCSARLNWDTEVVPVLRDYMVRMMHAGYTEMTRKLTLTHALAILNKLRAEDQDGTRPLYRPRNWNKEERRKDKKRKRHNWSTKGGHIAPIFVPPTPNGELAKKLREIAEKEVDAGVKFKIVETGGSSIKSQLQKPNPTASPGCEEPDCLPCKNGRGTGGNCRQSNVEYEFECQLCPENSRGVYLGETSRNLYSRAKEHLSNYRTGGEKSFIRKHQLKKHNGEEGVFKAKVTASYRDCLSRQVGEGVSIRRSKVEVLNGKSEWHQPALWRVQSEVYRG